MNRRRFRDAGNKAATAKEEPSDHHGDMHGQKDLPGPKEMSGPIEAVGRLMSLLELLPDATPPPNLLARTLRRVDGAQEYSGAAG
jgi:hypothetical protein